MSVRLKDHVDHWTKVATKQLVGKKIADVRYLGPGEVENLGWSSSCLVIQLEDGTLLFPSQDDEGNGPGALFGNDSRGKELTFPVIRI